MFELRPQARKLPFKPLTSANHLFNHTLRSYQSAALQAAYGYLKYAKNYPSVLESVGILAASSTAAPVAQGRRCVL